jgi:hypothetical protein
VHLIPTDEPEFADQVARVSRFFNDRVLTAPVSTVPAPALWKGGTPPATFVARGGQSLFGHHDPVVGDFDGDGQADVIWYGAGHECDTAWFGADHQTFFDPKEVFGTAYTAALEVEGDYAATVGDFDGDGRDDIGWYDAADGTSELWYGNADRTFDKSATFTLPEGLVLAAGDFDDDGHDDLLITSPSVAGAIVTFGDERGSFVDGTVLGGLGAGLTPIVGDFDGDEHADVYWRGATGNKLWFGVGRAGAASFAVIAAPASIGTAATKAPLVGDLDGDGADDLFWYVPGVKTAIWYGSPARATFVPGLTTIVNGFDAAGGDFDGDGRADVVFHSPTGPDYLWIGVADRVKGVSQRGEGIDVGAGFVAVAGRFGGAVSGSGKPVSDILWDPTS